MRISDWSSDVCSSDLGCDTFIEIGPQPVLCGLGRDCAEGTWIASLRRGADDVTTIRDAAATAWMRGPPGEGRAGDGARATDGTAVTGDQSRPGRPWTDGAPRAARRPRAVGRG